MGEELRLNVTDILSRTKVYIYLYIGFWGLWAWILFPPLRFSISGSFVLGLILSGAPGYIAYRCYRNYKMCLHALTEASIVLTKNSISIPAFFIRRFWQLPFAFGLLNKEPLSIFQKEGANIVIPYSNIVMWNTLTGDGDKILQLKIQSIAAKRTLDIALNSSSDVFEQLVAYFENNLPEKSPLKQGNLMDQFAYVASTTRHIPKKWVIRLVVVIVIIVVVQALAPLVSMMLENKEMRKNLMNSQYHITVKRPDGNKGGWMSLDMEPPVDSEHKMHPAK